MQRSIAERLRTRGHDVVAVTEQSGLRGISDPELFARAQEQARTLVTYNRDDYLAIAREYAASGRPHRGIVIVNSHRFPEGRSAGKLVSALERFIDAGASYPSFIAWLQ